MHKIPEAGAKGVRGGHTTFAAISPPPDMDKGIWVLVVHVSMQPKLHLQGVRLATHHVVLMQEACPFTELLGGLTPGSVPPGSQDRAKGALCPASLPALLPQSLHPPGYCTCLHSRSSVCVIQC